MYLYSYGPDMSFQPLSILGEIFGQNTPIRTYTSTAVQYNIIIWQCYCLESSALREHHHVEHVTFGSTNKSEFVQMIW